MSSSCKDEVLLNPDLITVGKKVNLKLDFMQESIKKVKEVVNERLNKYLK